MSPSGVTEAKSWLWGYQAQGRGPPMVSPLIRCLLLDYHALWGNGLSCTPHVVPKVSEEPSPPLQCPPLTLSCLGCALSSRGQKRLRPRFSQEPAEHARTRIKEGLWPHSITHHKKVQGEAEVPGCGSCHQRPILCVHEQVTQVS